MLPFFGVLTQIEQNEAWTPQVSVLFVVSVIASRTHGSTSTISLIPHRCETGTVPTNVTAPALAVDAADKAQATAVVAGLKIKTKFCTNNHYNVCVCLTQWASYRAHGRSKNKNKISH